MTWLIAALRHLICTRCATGTAVALARNACRGATDVTFPGLALSYLFNRQSPFYF